MKRVIKYKIFQLSEDGLLTNLKKPNHETHELYKWVWFKTEEEAYNYILNENSRFELPDNIVILPVIVLEK